MVVVPKVRQAVSLLSESSWIFPGEDIRGAGHLCEGAQFPAAGVRDQRHHREPQVRGVGAQRGAGAGDECDQGPGLALHLQLHPQHRGRDSPPGGQLLLSPRQPPPGQGQPPRPQQGRPAPPGHGTGQRHQENFYFICK